MLKKCLASNSTADGSLHCVAKWRTASVATTWTDSSALRHCAVSQTALCHYRRHCAVSQTALCRYRLIGTTTLCRNTNSTVSLPTHQHYDTVPYHKQHCVITWLIGTTTLCCITNSTTVSLPTHQHYDTAVSQTALCHYRLISTTTLCRITNSTVSLPTHRHYDTVLYHKQHCVTADSYDNAIHIQDHGR